MKITTIRLSTKQRAMLHHLVAAGGTVETILALVRHECCRGHSAGYARAHRLRRRGLITIRLGCIAITAAGRDAVCT